MKQSIGLLTVLMLSITTMFYGTVGMHNGTINIGGGLNYSKLTYSTDTQKEATTLEFLGGGFKIEFGYLYLSQGTLIHGLDTRVTFGMNFDPFDKLGGESSSLSQNVVSLTLDSFYFQVGTTYQLGTKIGNGRILVDIIGLNLGYFSVDHIVKYFESTTVYKPENNFLVGLNLPLGTTYIFDSGFMLGFRHRLDFAFSGVPASLTFQDNSITISSDNGGLNDQASYLAYNLTFSLGYVFGQ